jgi:hypothetical protein
MSNAIQLPGEVEVYVQFRKHFGPRYLGAGLGIQFHYNQTPGIHFKVDVDQQYREAILNGIKDGMAALFPDFPTSGSIWIVKVLEHPVDSAQIAFYAAARAAIEQAYSVSGNLRWKAPSTD